MGKICLSITTEQMIHTMELAEGQVFELVPNIPVRGFAIKVLETEPQIIEYSLRDLESFSIDTLIEIQKMTLEALQQRLEELQEELND